MEATDPTLTVPPTIYRYRFMAYLKWGGPKPQPDDDAPGIPESFRWARQEWLAMNARSRWPKRRLKAVCGVIQAHFVALFIHSNLSPWDTLVGGEDFVCPVVEVVGVDFSKGPIPLVCAKTFFELEFRTPIPDHDALGERQEANEYIDHGLVFRYDFEAYGPDDEWWVKADETMWSLEVYGPLAADDPGRTYAERVVNNLKEAGIPAQLAGPVLSSS